MSKAVQTVAGYELSYEAREVACHAIEMYVERLYLGADNLKVIVFTFLSTFLFFFYCCCGYFTFSLIINIHPLIPCFLLSWGA